MVRRACLGGLTLTLGLGLAGCGSNPAASDFRVQHHAAYHQPLAGLAWRGPQLLNQVTSHWRLPWSWGQSWPHSQSNQAWPSQQWWPRQWPGSVQQGASSTRPVGYPEPWMDTPMPGTSASMPAPGWTGTPILPNDGLPYLM